MRWQYRLLLSTLIISLMIGIALAAPAGPRSITGEIDYRLQPYSPQTNQALAGNITEINVNAWSVTRTWQGYFGNVTGTIVLADQSNQTLYDWSNTNPNGRIYASRNESVDWTTIACANKTGILDQTEAAFTLTNETDRNGNYPIDSVNNTFVTSIDYMRTDGVSSRLVQWANYSTFWVGPVQINGTYNSSGESEVTQCYSTVMHNQTGWVEGSQSAGNDPRRWRELLLADSSGNGDIVYTAILEQNYLGFDNKTHDFEMIVGEDGHGTNTATSTYYFYVELE